MSASCIPIRAITQALRELTRKYGTLLIIDETHTICAGPGGYTRAENLEPDFLRLRKADRRRRSRARLTGLRTKLRSASLDRQNLEDCDTGGIGGTLAGNALSLAAMRATLTKVLTKEAFDRMIPMAERWTDGVQRRSRSSTALARHSPGLPRRIPVRSTRLRRNGTQAHDAMDFELERFMHLYAMNRGILLTPFHNMALMSPMTAKDDIDQHTKVFREAVKELVG